jgi:pyruvate/2-oxoglutarate/acetoin dehydrogenase E1 component/TPP-dependent pyruvate/acetoin dehydrogenase alpha subunit
MNILMAPTKLPSVQEILHDYHLCCLSRHLSVTGRREVHGGRAKFGIFGDGKEVAQVALAHAFEPGDWRVGYYRGQTLMLALGLLTPSTYFAQLYGHTDVNADPNSGGRAMLGHFGSRILDADGRFLPQTDRFNSSADLSPTAGQMPRLVGLALASRMYRELPELQAMPEFSHMGNEVVFAAIGNASCAEGFFWESLNAIGVLRAPAVVSIWDDGYGISVPNEYQIMGGNLSTLLQGFRRPRAGEPGFDIYTVPGWDYPLLVDTYLCAAERARKEHVPAVVHVVQMTQPQGHSTSGSHERYKPPERLAFEQEYDPIRRMHDWLLEQAMATAGELDAIEQEARAIVERERDEAWAHYTTNPRRQAQELAHLVDEAALAAGDPASLQEISESLRSADWLTRRQLLEHAHSALIQLRNAEPDVRRTIIEWKETLHARHRNRYLSHLYGEGEESPLHVPAIAPQYAPDAPQVRGFEVLQANFDVLLERDPRVCIFGEDVGKLGDVNRGVAGLQEKYGELRVADTGIREATIAGQAIGLALRGLRPIAEIQYLDYILYALPTLADDLACLRWRTAGGHKAPVIIRTRGHRLEGIWHAGSQLAALIDLLRGVHLLVPRNMTQAAGFYNTLLAGDDPGIVIEVLNGYRLHERLPSNPGDYCVPLGVPEILRTGLDVTLVTYGACCRIALETAAQLTGVGIEVEVIDVQSLLPFDLPGLIGKSLQKTSRLVILDEDMPGGASAYILQQVLEVQNGYVLLDSRPRTITAQPHRPAYGTDGDYFSKPNAEDIFEGIYRLLHEAEPARFPLFFGAS